MVDEIVGKRFNRLVVEKRIDDYVAPSGGVHKKYACICDCGQKVTVLKEHLTSKRQQSCGCLRKENGLVKHGEVNTRLYRIWGNMCNRCSNPNNPAWKNYGGRGIFVCDSWRKYENFRDWALKNGYNETLTIDRIENNKGYSPSNCRWSDNYIQANNKRSNHMITYNGKTKTLSEWATFLHIPYGTLHRRVTTLGWDIQKAFNQPLRKSPEKCNLPNKRMVKNQICGEMNIAGIGAAQATATGKVADSAKIGRNASTIALIQDKTPDEIEADGIECGNKKLRICLNRNGAQMSSNEYIDLQFNGNTISYEEARQHIPVTPY